MGILDDVVTNAKSAASAVGKKAGEIVDISKLRFNAADLNSEINRQMQTLGRLVYEARKNEGESEEVEACIAKIEDLFEQLDVINEEIVIMRHKTVCPNCRKQNEKNAVYCSSCGTRIQAQTEQDFDSKE